MLNLPSISLVRTETALIMLLVLMIFWHQMFKNQSSRLKMMVFLRDCPVTQSKNNKFIQMEETGSNLSLYLWLSRKIRCFKVEPLRWLSWGTKLYRMDLSQNRLGEGQLLRMFRTKIMNNIEGELFDGLYFTFNMKEF